jgi:hypothetical protein
MTTDMTEKGLEDLIVAAMTGKASPAGSGGGIGERPAFSGLGGLSERRGTTTASMRSSCSNNIATMSPSAAG